MDKWYSNVSWHNRAWTGVLQLERSLTPQGKWIEVQLKRKIFSFPGRFFWTLRKQKAYLPPGEITMSILLSYMFSSLILVTEAIICKANKLFFFVCCFFLCVCHLYLLRRLNHCFQPCQVRLLSRQSLSGQQGCAHHLELSAMAASAWGFWAATIATRKKLAFLCLLCHPKLQPNCSAQRSSDESFPAAPFLSLPMWEEVTTPRVELHLLQIPEFTWNLFCQIAIDSKDQWH